MTKKLSKIGNSLGLVLERPLLDRLGIDAKTELEVSTDGSVIVISPKRSKRRDQRLKEVSDWMFEKYAGAFKKLAE
jgi:antitoxin component of MazEF toxin-antitoxin module